MDTDLKQDTQYRYSPHILLLVVIFIFQFFSKSKEVRAHLNPEQMKIGNKIFWSYLLVFQLAKAADWCLGPYVFEFFEKYHELSVDSIAKFIATSFLSSLFIGPLLVGYLNDKSDKKFPCILYGVMLGSSCLIRQIKHPFTIIISQVFFGASSSILYSSFENWFVSEANRKISDQTVKDMIISSAFEKSMIGDSLSAVLVSMITGSLKKQYGIQAPYMFSFFLCLCSIISVVIFITKIESKTSENQAANKHQISDVISNVKESLVECRKKPFIILIGLTESLLFSCLHIFIFAWTPTLRELNEDVDTGEVFTLFMMSLMLGGAAFKAIYLYFNSDSFKVVKVVSLLSTVGFAVANMKSSYQSTLYAFLCYEVSVGIFYPAYSKLKSEYLPAHMRGTLMNVFKIPLNLIVIFLLLTMNIMFTISQLLMLNLFVSLFVMVVHNIFFYKGRVDASSIKHE